MQFSRQSFPGGSSRLQTLNDAFRSYLPVVGGYLLDNQVNESLRRGRYGDLAHDLGANSGQGVNGSIRFQACGGDGGL